MRITHTKTITILIAGAVFTAGLIMSFGGYVFAGDPITGLDITICQNPPGPCSRVSDKIYDSSFSKTKSIGLVRKEVGDVLLRYGVGGADINKVTEALEGKGVYEAELKWFLLAIGINEKDAQDILVEFDTIGIGKDSAQAVSPDAPEKEFTTGDPASVAGQPGAGQIEEGVSTPDAGGAVPSPSSGTLKELLPSTVRKTGSQGDYFPMQNFKLEIDGAIQNLKAAESKEQRENIRKELKISRETLQKSAEALRQDLRANAQDLRENFRENVKTTIGHVDHGKTARIALAHGKGLRMINRYRSAIARFDHILGRLESRVEKIENEAQARSEQGKLKDILPSAILLIENEAQAAEGNILKVNNPGKEMAVALIEEAKNMQVLNKAKLAELEAKYESLLTGQNPGGIAKEARAIAKELKSEIEKLHGLLDDIKQAATDYNSSVSNTSTSF